MSEIRGLTVRQPWAWAIVHGGKDVENRTRSLGPYRGPIAIHGGLTFDWTANIGDSPIGTAIAERPDALVNDVFLVGHVMGVVDLVDVHVDGDAECSGDDPWGRCSPWAQWSDVDHPTMHHLVLRNPRPLAEPIPWRGALSLWRVPDELEARIREQVTL